MLALILATIWTVTAPDSGATPQWYEWRVRDFRGVEMLRQTTPDTFASLEVACVPHRVDARAGCLDASGDTLHGKWSVPSALFIQPDWYATFMEMGRRTNRLPLSMVTAAAAALTARWTDPPLPHEE